MCCIPCYLERIGINNARAHKYSEESIEKVVRRKANLFKLLQDNGIPKDIFKEIYKYYRSNC